MLKRLGVFALTLASALPALHAQDRDRNYDRGERRERERREERRDTNRDRERWERYEREKREYDRYYRNYYRNYGYSNAYTGGYGYYAAPQSYPYYSNGCWYYENGYYDSYQVWHYYQ